MPDSLEQRLRHIRRRIRGVLWLYGLSWLVLVVFGTTLAVGFADWLVHLDDPGVRLILGLGILAAGLWAAWRFLVAPLLVKLSDVDIAFRIERRHPRFRDSLASSVEFLGRRADPQIGSAVMQRDVIRKTLAQAERLNLADIIDTRSLRRVAGSAILLCGAAAVVVGVNQAAAATALKRLVAPFSGPAWPKTTQLRLLDETLQPLDGSPEKPWRVARGRTLKVLVENTRGPLPEDARIEYRFEDTRTTAEPLRRTTIEDDEGQARDVGVATFVASRGPVAFRAVGGDHREMPWHRLESVPPPRIEKLQVTLAPPAYTQRKSERLPADVGDVHSLVGTRVELKARTNKPLQSVALRHKGAGRQNLEPAAGRRSFETSFRITEPGVSSYWFELKDREGFENTETQRYEIRGIPDRLPVVKLTEPAGDRYVTPEAVVPLEISASDDLGLKEVRLHYRIGPSDDRPETSLVLYEGPDRPREHVTKHDWSLADLSLRPRDRVVYHAEAVDFAGPDHAGRSGARALEVISPARKLDELASRQAGLLEKLTRVENMQTRAGDDVAELRLQLEKVGRLRPEDVDLLKRVEADQRRISSRLLNPVDGVEAETRKLLDELEHNRLDSPEMQRHLAQIAEELAAMRRQQLPVIERELTRARKRAEAEEKNGNEAEQSQSLKTTGENQAAVLESVRSMIATLSRWRHRRDLAGDVDSLIESQEKLNRETARLGRQTLGKSLDELTPQQQADLARLAERQRAEGRSVEQLREKMQKAVGELEETDPAAAERLSEVLDALAERATRGRMREAAGNLEANRIGQATDRQEQVLRDLRDLQEKLRSRTDDGTENLVKQLERSERLLDELRKRQEELLHKLQNAGEKAEGQQREAELKKLRQQQQELRKQTNQLAQRLKRLRARRSAESTGRAGQRMQQAEQGLQQNAGEEALRRLEKAVEDLEQARRELAQSREQAEERLAQELLERIGGQLQSMIDSQQNVIEETKRLDGLRRERGNWSRSQLKFLQSLADVQRGLQQDTEHLIDKLEAAEVFALALRGAARQMEKAAGRLSERQTDEKTLAAERAAKQRFVDLLAALKSGQNNDGNQGGKRQPGDQEQQAGPPGEQVPPLAELRMLKTLQEDLNRRTDKLHELAQSDDGLSEEQAVEFERLASEQERLADLARNLTQTVRRPSTADDEDDDDQGGPSF